MLDTETLCKQASKLKDEYFILMELNIIERLGVAWWFTVWWVVFDPEVLKTAVEEQEKPNISLEWFFEMKSRVPALPAGRKLSYLNS